MSSSNSKLCPACGCSGMNPGDALPNETIEIEFQKLIPGIWNLDNENKSINRSFVCKNFKSAIEFINDIAKIADSNDVNHHPDIHLTGYRNVTVNLFTHSVKGLTAFDFKLAKAIEEVKVDFSPKWLKENPSNNVLAKTNNL
eukprot:gene17839-23451_t